MKIEVTFHHEQALKKAHRYREVDGDGAFLDNADAICGTIYVKMSAIKGDPPDVIKVTIEAE